MQVLGPNDEVVRGQQHLTGDETVARQLRLVDLHQRQLADRGDRLQGHSIARAVRSAEPEFGKAGCDRTGRDDYDIAAVGP